MKKTIALLLLAIVMAATTFAQNDPLSVSLQRTFTNGYIPIYTTGGFKVLVRNNTTKGLEQTIYTIVNDTVNGTFMVLGNGATGHALDLATHSHNAFYWAKQNRAGGKTHLSDTSGTYYIDVLSDSGIHQLYPLSTKNKVYSISAKPGLTYGIGAKGNGYLRLDDSGNTTKYLEIDPLVGVNSKDTLFLNQKFLSVRTISGNAAITADTTQTTINSNKLRIGSATAPFIKSGSGTPLFVVSAPVGSLYLRTNGVADSTLYIKSAGVDSAGWYPAKH